jgi:hypothetical protein
MSRRRTRVRLGMIPPRWPCVLIVDPRVKLALYFLQGRMLPRILPVAD